MVPLTAVTADTAALITVVITLAAILATGWLIVLEIRNEQLERTERMLSVRIGEHFDDALEAYGEKQITGLASLFAYVYSVRIGTRDLQIFDLVRLSLQDSPAMKRAEQMDAISNSEAERQRLEP